MKKKTGCILACLGCVFLLCIAVVVVGIVAYKAISSGSSTFFGLNKPRDLGVVATQADYDSYVEKMGTTYVEVDSIEGGKTIEFSNPTYHEDLTLSQEECTARVNYARWEHMPIRDVQVRFNSDGSIEFSGFVIIERLIPFLNEIGYEVSQEDVDAALEGAESFPVDPAIYVKTRPVISENSATVDVIAVSVGPLTINPDDYNADSVVSGLVAQIFSQVPGFYARSVTIGEGTLAFDGTSPTTVEVVTEE